MEEAARRSLCRLPTWGGATSLPTSHLPRSFLLPASAPEPVSCSAPGTVASCTPTWALEACPTERPGVWCPGGERAGPEELSWTRAAPPGGRRAYSLPGASIPSILFRSCDCPGRWQGGGHGCLMEQKQGAGSWWLVPGTEPPGAGLGGEGGESGREGGLAHWKVLALGGAASASQWGLGAGRGHRGQGQQGVEGAGWGRSRDPCRECVYVSATSILRTRVSLPTAWEHPLILCHPRIRFSVIHAHTFIECLCQVRCLYHISPSALWPSGAVSLSWGRPVHCRVLSSNCGPCPLGASSNLQL